MEPSTEHRHENELGEPSTTREGRRMIRPLHVLPLIAIALFAGAGCHHDSEPPRAPGPYNWQPYYPPPPPPRWPPPSQTSVEPVPWETPRAGPAEEDPAVPPLQAPAPSTFPGTSSKLDSLIDCAKTVGGEKLCGVILTLLWPSPVGAAASSGFCNAIAQYYRGGSVSWGEVLEEIGFGYGLAKIGRLGSFLDAAKTAMDFGSCLDDKGLLSHSVRRFGRSGPLGARLLAEKTGRVPTLEAVTKKVAAGAKLDEEAPRVANTVSSATED